MDHGAWVHHGAVVHGCIMVGVWGGSRHGAWGASWWGHQPVGGDGAFAVPAATSGAGEVTGIDQYFDAADDGRSVLAQHGCEGCAADFDVGSGDLVFAP